MPKPKFVRLTITLTYYGVGKTIKDAKQDAFNEFANNQNDLYNSNDYNQEIDEVERDDTTIDQSYVDFVMGDDYSNHDAKDLLKGGK